ncbi:MAG: hypothetical protein ACQER9_00455 [Nanobdellota archaeon]
MDANMNGKKWKGLFLFFLLFALVFCIGVVEAAGECTGPVETKWAEVTWRDANWDTDEWYWCSYEEGKSGLGSRNNPVTPTGDCTEYWRWKIYSDVFFPMNVGDICATHTSSAFEYNYWLCSEEINCPSYSENECKSNDKCTWESASTCGDGTVQSPNDNGINEKCDPGTGNFGGTHCIESGSDRCTCQEGYSPDGNGGCVQSFLDIGLKIQDGGEKKVAIIPPDSSTQSPLKIYDDQEYSVALVDPSHSDALSVKIQTDDGVKALREYKS